MLPNPNMPNRNLSESELEIARNLIDQIRCTLEEMADGDSELLFALRRKVYKELTYDEREKPAFRKKLKSIKRDEQDGICPLCGKTLPQSYCVLDRINAIDGYTAENTRLIHKDCDVAIQSGRGYK